MRKRNGFIGGAFVGIIILCLIIGIFKCTEAIPAGYVGVVYNMNGGIEKNVLKQGFKVIAPTKTVTLYSIALEPSYMTASNQGDSKENESFEIPTKEGAALEVDVAFSYSYDINRVPEVFTRFRGQDGKEILQSFIKPKMQAWIKEITPEFSMIDIVSKQRGVVNAAITDTLKARFDKYGIVIDNVALADVRPDKDTSEAIKKKIKAQESLETAKIEAEKDKVRAQKDKDIALIDAERDKEAAAIEAEKARIKAEGVAAARETESKAEAEAIKRISNALTSEYNKYIHNKQWNGVEPQFIGGNADAIFDMRNE